MLQELKQDIKKAQIGKDKERLSTLRLLMSNIQNIALSNKRKDFTEDDAIQALTKFINQRQDAIAIYRDNNRKDLVEKEQNELDILNEYLPKQLTDEEIDSLVKEAIGITGAKFKKQVGKVFGYLKTRIQPGTVDFKKLNLIISGRLE